MSTPLAIAAATATLRTLLLHGIQRGDSTLSDLQVTAQPPDRAREGIRAAQLNLFLYQTSIDGAWRNQDLPSRTRPGETGAPPLPLNLRYVLTAYGRADDDNDAVSHRVLGGALSVLHDHPLLGRDEIKDALPDAELHLQLERLRVTPHDLPVEEISKLWTAFQSPYRLSAAIQVAVVLIDSRRPVKAPVPVLSRGPADSGPQAAGSLENPFPNLSAIVPPAGQPSALPGDTVTLQGGKLAGSSLGVRFRHPAWDAPAEVAPGAAGDAEVAVTVPDHPATWPAGVYTVSLLVQRPGETYRRETNTLPLVLAPRLEAVAPDPAHPDVNGDVTLTATVSPLVLPGQRVALLLGDREVAAQPRAAATATPSFVVRGAPLGAQWVRVRVDGTDSLLVRRDVTPPVFDPTHRVTIA